MEQLPDAGAGEAKSEQKPKRRSRKKLWVIIVLALVSAIAWVVIYLTRAQQSYYDGHVMPVYGVFLTTPLYSAYAMVGYNSSIIKLLRMITAKMALFTLSVVSFVIGICIYAARKITRR